MIYERGAGRLVGGQGGGVVQWFCRGGSSEGDIASRVNSCWDRVDGCIAWLLEKLGRSRRLYTEVMAWAGPLAAPDKPACYA